MELQEVITEMENSKQISSSVSSLINDTSQCFYAISDMLLVSILFSYSCPARGLSSRVH